MVSLNTKITAMSNPKSIIAEQYRSLLTNIKLANKDRNLKSIVITSALPKEGKTTTVVNLGVTLAMQNSKVLIIDANLKRPTVHQHFNLNNNEGLVEILSEKHKKPEEIIQQTDIENLHILTSGMEKLNVIESSNIMQLLTCLYDKYDYIFIDSTSILESSITKVIANNCDGVMMVVAKGKTKLKETLAAKRELQFIEDRVLGVILNDNKQTIVQKAIRKIYKK